jgi:hypothetical protein
MSFIDGNGREMDMSRAAITDRGAGIASDVSGSRLNSVRS